MSEPRLSAAAAPRRRIDRETTPGRCGNLDYCSIGMQRVLVKVPVSAPFVCPECGSRLRPPGGPVGSRRPWVLPTLRVGVLAACSLGALAIGYTIGHVQPMVVHAVQAATQHADARLKAAETILEVQAPVAPRQQALAPASQVPPTQAVIEVRERPFLPHTAMPDSEPPSRLPHETRFGQVTVDCTLGAKQPHPACITASIRGGDAFSDPAVTWLQSLNVRYHAAGGPPRDHRWRVIFQDFAAAPKEPAGK